jgi:hypothetical protein
MKKQIKISRLRLNFYFISQITNLKALYIFFILIYFFIVLYPNCLIKWLTIIFVLLYIYIYIMIIFMLFIIYVFQEFYLVLIIVNR